MFAIDDEVVASGRERYERYTAGMAVRAGR